MFSEPRHHPRDKNESEVNAKNKVEIALETAEFLPRRCQHFVADGRLEQSGKVTKMCTPTRRKAKKSSPLHLGPLVASVQGCEWHAIQLDAYCHSECASWIAHIAAQATKTLLPMVYNHRLITGSQPNLLLTNSEHKSH